MIETIFIAMVAAKIKGYKVKALFKSWEVYPVLVFVLIYLFLNIEVFFGRYYLINHTGTLESLYICSFFPLIIKYKRYVSAIAGSAAIIIGTILNKIVIATNNGKMPVFPTLSYKTGYFKTDAFTKVNDIHILGNNLSKLKPLTDIIDLGYSVLSVGDVFIRFFTFLIIYSSIKVINESKNKVIGNSVYMNFKS